MTAKEMEEGLQVQEGWSPAEASLWPRDAAAEFLSKVVCKMELEKETRLG